MVKPRLLITRFEPHAQRLCLLLNAHGVFSIAQPLLKIERVKFDRHPFAKNYDFIIAVSANAVEYTQLSLQAKKWPSSEYLAVGEATKQQLQKYCGHPVTIPAGSFNSEGVLALPMLKSLANCSVLILRGVSGREYLKNELIARGAEVDYFESYRRVALVLPRSLSVDKWQQKMINGVIISSIELLDHFINLTEKEDSEWAKSLILYSESQRILKYAHSLGFHKTALLPSIVDQDIIDYFTDEGSYERD